jgi:DNA topoisomerase-1
MDYTIEIPGLFQGHGKHPLQGRIKKRITPEDVTLNISDSYVPKCSVRGKSCKWGNIVENRDVTWLYTWKNPITGEMSTKGLARIDSPFVCSKDMEKFDKAQMLEKNIKNIREKYTADLSNKLQTKRELATAVYLLDTLAIRPGTEKDEAVEADTVGLTTLRCENISFEAGNLITLDFTGKSSIRFVKTFQVSEEVFKNLKSFCASRSGKDALFPLLSATTLNDYLKTLLPSLTAKVFRTWKASSILQKALNEEKVDEDEPVHAKQLAYNKVNIEVAKALNHKKMSDSDAQVAKLQAKLNEQEEKLKVAKTDSQKRLTQKAIDMAKVKLIEAQENISTGTSKLNYLDPRISIAWAKKVGLPIEKIYNARTAKKFVWAMDSPSTWRFAEIGIKKKRK